MTNTPSDSDHNQTPDAGAGEIDAGTDGAGEIDAGEIGAGEIDADTDEMPVDSPTAELPADPTDSPMDDSSAEPLTDDSSAEPPMDDSSAEPPGGEPPPPMAPPSSMAPPGGEPPPPMAPPRLMRDPNGTVGGVLSGLSYYFGVDVSLVRVAFVIFAIATFGSALLAYLVAWVVIPSADHWPPTGQRLGAGSIERHHVGVGLIIVGAILAAGVSNFSRSPLILALMLVGGGIWILSQRGGGNSGAQAVGSNPVGAERGPDASYPSYPTYPTSGEPVSPTYQSAPVPPLPAKAKPKRSRRRKVLLTMLIGGLVLVFIIVPLAAIFGVILFVGANGSFTEGVDMDITSVEVSDFPMVIDEGNGDIQIDLSDIDLDSIPASELPLDVNVDLGFGQVIIEVPEGADVSSDLSVGFGEVVMFDQKVGGVGSDLTRDDPDAHFDISVDLVAGSVKVIEG